MSKSNSSELSLSVQDSAVPETTARKGGRSFVRYGLFVTFGIFFVIVSILRPGFLSQGNFYDILVR